MRSKTRGKTWGRQLLLASLLGALAVPAVAQSTAITGDWGTYVGAAAGVPDTGDVGLKVFAGQQLHRYFGWEAAITRFARETDNTPLGEVRTDFWGISGAAVGILAVNTEFSGFAKIGAMAGRKRVRGPGGDRNDNDLNLLLGIGARYAITPRVAIRAEFEDFNQGDLFSVGVSYKF